LRHAGNNQAAIRLQFRHWPYSSQAAVNKRAGEKPEELDLIGKNGKMR
jgi:hypothetical protein